ncbi:porin [Piscinibacter koreensis]|uniref:Porin n=1 Tax=Piscinibacter koreensis TaxID=2742824 RepID=A0A7Y6NTV7_9BURK|nr:porin [Schlegelella koreensis]NUZ09112.1 porin [Schlegelella koreensis]
MKKSVLALAVLGAFTGVASAQSSVTLYGTVDLSGRYVKNEGSARRFSLGSDGLNSSQLGFRGVEDLGGGLKASFVLLAGVNADSGTTNGKFFNRRSTVSLSSNAGEIRLGRDYTPTFWNMTLFDAFGTVGLGSSLNTAQRHPGTRQDNTIGYFLPTNLGGLYGQFMAGSSEGGTSGDRAARYLGGRVGFAAGPFDVAVAAAQIRYRGAAFNGWTAGAPGGAIANDDQKSVNVGASWNFGFAKLMGYVDYERLDNATDDRELRGSISAVIPFGQNEVHVGYDRSRLRRDGASNSTAQQLKASYVYNLSKRTAVYGTVSYLDNNSNAAMSIAPASGTNASTGSQSATALPRAGGDSRGVEFGVRHFF